MTSSLKRIVQSLSGILVAAEMIFRDRTIRDIPVTSGDAERVSHSDRRAEPPALANVAKCR